MSEAPKRIWVAMSEHGDMAMNSRGEQLCGYARHEEYVRSDIADRLLAALNAVELARMSDEPDHWQAATDLTDAALKAAKGFPSMFTAVDAAEPAGEVV